MTKKDIAEVKQVVADGIRESTKQLQVDMQRHEITLFGVKGDNGINSTVKDHERALGEIRIANAKAAALYSVLAGAGGLLGSILVKVIFR